MPARVQKPRVIGREPQPTTTADGQVTEPPFPWATVYTVGRDLEVMCQLGSEPARVTRGYARFTPIARPRLRDIDVFEGLDLFEMDLPLLLEGWDTGTSVAPLRDTLELMASPRGRDPEPPVVRVAALGVPHTSLKWRISGLQWGAGQGRNGVLLRQPVTVTLLQHVSDQALSESIEDSRSSGKGKGSRERIIKARRGEDLYDIARRAKRELNRAVTAVALARLNNLSVKARLKAGQRIRIP